MESPWYTQGDFEPLQRLEFTLSNTQDFDRENIPVVIKRENFPLPDTHEMWVTVVDPSLPPFAGPSEELLRVQGGHQLRAETNGHAIFHQLDDLDKDGIWDELFFQTDMEAHSEKVIYIYIGLNNRGWNKHFTHANIGSYLRHQVPFWESENVGWNLWFPNAINAYAKRKPELMSQHLYMENLSGYGVSGVNPDWGTDIQGIGDTFGAGAICLFEDPQKPDLVSLPRYTPVKQQATPGTKWNAGPMNDTRYAYDVIANGPVRSIIRIKGMNWDTGNGSYEYEQHYTAYARQSFTRSEVLFTTFSPTVANVNMGVGFRKRPKEDHFVQEGGIIISSGPDSIRDPESSDNRKSHKVEFVGNALIVKDSYKPEYQFVEDHRGNHTFRITAPKANSFEFLVSSAWSEGAVYNNRKDFSDYIRKTSLEYNNPVLPEFVQNQNKSSTNNY
jgi:hypothetical protein